MFKCGRCSRITEPSEKQQKLVAKTRPRIYPDGSKGWEIVEEIAACLGCLEKVENDKKP